MRITDRGRWCASWWAFRPISLAVAGGIRGYANGEDAVGHQGSCHAPLPQRRDDLRRALPGPGGPSRWSHGVSADRIGVMGLAGIGCAAPIPTGARGARVYSMGVVIRAGARTSGTARAASSAPTVGCLPFRQWRAVPGGPRLKARAVRPYRVGVWSHGRAARDRAGHHWRSRPTGLACGQLVIMPVTSIIANPSGKIVLAVDSVVVGTDRGWVGAASRVGNRGMIGDHERITLEDLFAASES